MSKSHKAHPTPTCQHGGTCAACFGVLGTSRSAATLNVLTNHLPASNWLERFNSESVSPGLRPPIG